MSPTARIGGAMLPLVGLSAGAQAFGVPRVATLVMKSEALSFAAVKPGAAVEVHFGDAAVFAGQATGFEHDIDAGLLSITCEDPAAVLDRQTVVVGNYWAAVPALEVAQALAARVGLRLDAGDDETALSNARRPCGDNLLRSNGWTQDDFAQPVSCWALLVELSRLLGFNLDAAPDGRVRFGPASNVVRTLAARAVRIKRFPPSPAAVIVRSLNQPRIPTAPMELALSGRSRDVPRGVPCFFYHGNLRMNAGQCATAAERLRSQIAADWLIVSGETATDLVLFEAIRLAGVESLADVVLRVTRLEQVLADGVLRTKFIAQRIPAAPQERGAAIIAPAGAESEGLLRAA